VIASLLIGLVLGAPAALSLEESAATEFRKGVELAGTDPGPARRSFREAARLFEALHTESDAANPGLYRNIGNAYILSLKPDDRGDTSLAHAILAYRHGLRLAPNDGELQRNLEYARQQVVYPPPGTFGRPAVDHRPPWLPRWPGLLCGLAVACYALGCLAVARWWMVRHGSWLTTAGVCYAVMLIFVAAWTLEVWQMRQEERYPVVVIAEDDVRLLVGNGPRYPHRYETSVQRGVEARLRYDRGRWLQIELGGGEIGWVPRSAVLIDEP
jgi:hypothetical protein